MAARKLKDAPCPNETPWNDCDKRSACLAMAKLGSIVNWRGGGRNCASAPPGSIDAGVSSLAAHCHPCREVQLSLALRLLAEC